MSTAPLPNPKLTLRTDQHGLSLPATFASTGPHGLARSQGFQTHARTRAWANLSQCSSRAHKGGPPLRPFPKAEPKRSGPRKKLGQLVASVWHRVPLRQQDTNAMDHGLGTAKHPQHSGLPAHSTPMPTALRNGAACPLPFKGWERLLYTCSALHLHSRHVAMSFILEIRTSPAAAHDEDDTLPSRPKHAPGFLASLLKHPGSRSGRSPSHVSKLRCSGNPEPFRLVSHKSNQRRPTTPELAQAAAPFGKCLKCPSRRTGYAPSFLSKAGQSAIRALQLHGSTA